MCWKITLTNQKNRLLLTLLTFRRLTRKRQIPKAWSRVSILNTFKLKQYLLWVLIPNLIFFIITHLALYLRVWVTRLWALIFVQSDLGALSVAVSLPDGNLWGIMSWGLGASIMEILVDKMDKLRNWTIICHSSHYCKRLNLDLNLISQNTPTKYKRFTEKKQVLSVLFNKMSGYLVWK